MRRHLLVILLAILLFFFIYPSSFLGSSKTLPDDNDTRLIAYIIGQVQTNLLHHQPLFFGTYFAPYPNTLTYSEPFLTSALITLPVRIFTSSPIAIFNLALIIGFVLTFITSFLLFSYLTQSSWLGLLGALLFNLSGFHLTYLPHLQMFSLGQFFLTTYFFLRFQNENNSRFLDLFFIALTFQITESLFGAYLIFFTCLFIFIFNPKNFKKILLRSFFFLPLWFIFLFPYLQMSHTFPEAARPIRDAAHFSLGLEEIFTKYNSWPLIILFILLAGQNILRTFAESVEAIFCKVRRAWSPENSGVYALQTRNFLRGPSELVERGVDSQIDRKLSVALNLIQKTSIWSAIFLFSLIMSLGPVVKIFGHSVKILGLPLPLPYTAFYYLFPGFTGLRTPSRFIVLTAIAATILIIKKIFPYTRKLLPITKISLTLLLILCLMLQYHFPLPSYPVDTLIPKVYDQVKPLPQTAIILELPLKLWNDEGHEIESLRSLYSLSHQHRRIGGYSGFAPLAWIDLVEQIKSTGLSPENLNRLHALGVTHLVENNTLRPLP